jgi:hypothetical protein
MITETAPVGAHPEAPDVYASARLDAHKAALAQLEWLDPANDLVPALRREVHALERERSHERRLAA